MKRIFLISAVICVQISESFGSYLQNPFRDRPVFVYDLIQTEIAYDRHLGAFIGLILGDMLGIALEFVERKQFSFDEPRTEAMRQALWPTELLKIYLDTFSARHFNALGWYPGEWSDDVSVALCVSVSLIEKGFDLKDHLKKWMRWREQGYMSYRKDRIDSSLSMARVLSAFETLKDKKEFDWTTLGLYNKHTFTQKLSEGNSALMRVAPLVVWAVSHDKDFAETLLYVKKHTQLTHGAAKSVESAVVLGALLWKALKAPYSTARGLKESMFVFSEEELAVMNLKEKEVLYILKSEGKRDWRHKKENKIKATGFSLDTLEAALWAFHQGSDFESVMRSALALGGDTGTVASVTGQLAGVCYGLKSFPKKWLERLWGYDILMKMGESLMKNTNK